MALPAPESFTLAEEYDFVIVGSGGGSMAAALYAKKQGLNPVILEKLDVIGGSTGYSGGVWWVPNHHVMARHGVHDSMDEARKYFAAVRTFKGKGTTPERTEAFLEKAPEMVQFLEDEGMVYYYPDGWADYYDSAPGGNSHGRSLMAEPFNANVLGPWKDKLSAYEPFDGIPLPSFRLMGLTLIKRSFKSKLLALELGLKMAINKLLGRKVVANGAAIQARMLELTLKAGIPVFTGFATDRLVEEDARVVAAEGMYRGKRTAVRSRYGVLVNSGGFARNEEMRKQYHRGPTSATWTNATPGDTGEMIREMMRIGADAENLDTAVWIPSTMKPDGTAQAGATGKKGQFFPFMHNADLGTPSIIFVDKTGNRFTNEANSYMEVGETMYDKGTFPAFVVFDDFHMKNYGLGPLLPGMKPIRKWLEEGYLLKGDTIEELAGKAGIDPAGLKAQVERFNRYSETGVDEEFHKGERQYDLFRGDPTRGLPNPCLGPIAKAPFYAVHLFPSDVGTFGGVVSDERARVLRADGSVIEGLYATGNCTSSVMGRTYLGAGASISPSFAFGYIAAIDAVAKARAAG